MKAEGLDELNQHTTQIKPTYEKMYGTIKKRIYDALRVNIPEDEQKISKFDKYFETNKFKNKSNKALATLRSYDIHNHAMKKSRDSGYILKRHYTSKPDLKLYKDNI